MPPRTHSQPQMALWVAASPAHRLRRTQAWSWHRSWASHWRRRWTGLPLRCCSREGEVCPLHPAVLHVPCRRLAHARVFPEPTMPLPIAFGIHASVEGSGEVGCATSHRSDPVKPRLGKLTILPRLAGSLGWGVEAQGGENRESLTELDTLPASEDRQQADDAIWREVTAVSLLWLHTVGDAGGSQPSLLGDRGSAALFERLPPA